MKKMRLKKRIYAFVLMLVMVVSLIPTSMNIVKAADEEEQPETFAAHVLVDSKLEWSNPNIHFWGSDNTAWPGNALGESVGKATTDGKDQYDVYDVELKNGLSGIIINSNGQQTANIENFSDKEMWIIVSKTDDGNSASVTYSDPRAKVVYVKAPQDYEEVAIHYWGGASSAWPGVQLTETTEDGYYIAVVPYAATGFLIDNNKASGGIQTTDGSFKGDITYAEVTITEGNDAIRTEDYDFMKYNRVFVRAKSLEKIYYHAWGGEGVQGTSWPGVELTDAAEDGWYTLDLLKGYTGFMFTNGAADNTAKSADINVETVLETGKIYFEVAGDFTFEATTDKPVDGITVYFKGLPEDFGTPNIYYWGGQGQVSWPGVPVTEKNEATGYYVAELPLGTEKFIINNGDKQSEDIAIVGDKNYYIYGEDQATTYNPDNFTKVFVKVLADWDEVAAYEFKDGNSNGGDWSSRTGWPGTALTNADEDGWYTVLLDKNYDLLILNNNNNGAQTANLNRTDYVTNNWLIVGEDKVVTAYATKKDAEDAIPQPEVPEDPEDPSKPAVPTTFTVHVKAPSTWTTVRAYIADSSWTSITGSWDNATEMTKGEDGWYTIDIKIKKAPHYYIFHNGAGEQSGDLEYTGTTDVWFDITTQGADGKYTGTALNQNPDELSAAEKAEAEKKAAEEAAKAEAEKKAAEEAAAAEKLANSKTFTVYVKVPASWTNACYYTWQDLAPDYPNLQPWPGTTLKDKDGEWFKAVVPNNMDTIIFNNGKDAVQTKNITISGTEYFVVNEDGTFERFATKPTSNDIAKAEAEKAARLNNTYNVYVKVDASWTNACYYAWAKEPFEDLSKWPGTKLPTETKDGWFVVKVPTFMDWIIINDGKSEGAVQTEDINTKGQECYISVNKDGSYEVVDASGNKVAGQEPAKVTEGVEKVTIYVKVPEDWATPRLWAWGTEGNLYDAWPGAALVKEGDWYVATIPTWVTSLLVNGNDGAIQTQDIKLAEIGKDIYLTVISADEYTIEYKDVVAREDVVADDTTVASNKDEDKKDEVKEETDPVKDQAVVADTTEEASSVFSTQTIMLIITAIIVLICGVVVITILARKKSFNTKE